MKPLPGVVVLDTCVLISSVLREAILSLARQGSFAPAWSAVIGDEWRRNAARLWELPAEDVAAQWDALQAAWPGADLGDVAAWKEGLEHSDPKDWHVIAAARRAADCAAIGRTAGDGANASCAAADRGAAEHRTGGVAIVTRNIKDFHRGELYHLGLELLDPDQLLCRCLAHRPAAVDITAAAIPDYASAWGRGPEPLEAILKRERLYRFNRLLQARHEPADNAAIALQA